MFFLGNQKTASLGNQKKRAGRPPEFFERKILVGDRLTARPKHSDFQERISLRGEIKERKSSVEADTLRVRKREIVFETLKALQAFRESASMTEGARSFRRRGAVAHRFLAPHQK